MTTSVKMAKTVLDLKVVGTLRWDYKLRTSDGPAIVHLMVF